MTTNGTTIVDSVWKDRIERALKHISRTIDTRQRRDAVPLLTSIAEQVQRAHESRRPRPLPAYSIADKKSTLYTSCSFDVVTGDKLTCSMSVLPQVDQLPNMFTYVSLQRNFLCDTMTNLSDLILDEEDEDVKNLVNSTQSDLPVVQQVTRSASSSKRTRRSSKTSVLNDRNNEFIFDDEHLIELLKRLKQQPGHTAIPMTSEDETALVETLIKLYPSSADLIRERFGTIFETKRIPPKEFTPNIDNSPLALDTTVENTLHSYFMLFCRRCHRYDCFLHKDKQAVPDLKIPSKNDETIYQPCSRHCFRISPVLSHSQRRAKIELKRSHSDLADNALCKSPTNGYHPKRTKINLIKTEPTSSVTSLTFSTNGFLFKPSIKRKCPPDDLSDWSASEKSLFRVFYTIYGENICMIAELLDKPCSQVHQIHVTEVQFQEAQAFLERQISTASSSTASLNGNGVRINGTTTNSGEDSIDDDKPMCNGKDDRHLPNHPRSSSRRSHSLSFRRQRSHQNLLLNHHNHLSLEQKRHTYYPCDHDRSVPCNEHCFCLRSGNFCEKYCCCSSSKCDNRFPGCRCRSSCTTKQCPCYAAGRECDPDLCTQCGADDFRSAHNEMRTKSVCSCHNVAIQRSLHKSLLLAESDVAGWGIFTQVNIQRNEFIAEYCGEILTQDEGELRGRVYDTIGTSFLFDLNEEYMVDATRRGNKIRFANHSINPNCYAKVIMVNGDHRIGIYSKRFISSGEELFFDYRYGANHHLRFVGVEKNTCQDQNDTPAL